MNKYLSLFVSLFIISIQSCSGMENPNKLFSPASSKDNIITAIEHPLCLFPLNNNDIIIIGAEAYVLYNNLQKKVIKTFDTFQDGQKSFSITAAIDQKKERLAVLRRKTLTIYTINTGEKIYTNKNEWYNKPVFSLNNNDILYMSNFYNEIKSINCKDRKNSKIFSSKAIPANMYMVPNPKENRVTTLYDNNILIIDSTNNSLIVNKKTQLQDTLQQGIHSGDGKFLFLINMNNNSSILNVSSNTEETFLQFPASVMAMAFMPYNYILATIVLNENKISLWNILTKKQIDVIWLNEKYILKNLCGSYCICQNFMAFSPDGSKIFVAFNKKVEVFCLPSKLQPFLPHNKCTFALWILRQINILPVEVTHYLIKHLFTAYKE